MLFFIVKTGQSEKRSLILVSLLFALTCVESQRTLATSQRSIQSVVLFIIAGSSVCCCRILSVCHFVTIKEKSKKPVPEKLKHFIQND